MSETGKRAIFAKISNLKQIPPHPIKAKGKRDLILFLKMTHEKASLFPPLSPKRVHPSDRIAERI